MRQAEKQKKKILLPNSVQARHGQENSEKNSKKIEKIKKTSFRHYFLPRRDEIGREREKKKNLHPNSVHARPWQENSEKIAKKLKKIKKLFQTLFLAKTG